MTAGSPVSAQGAGWVAGRCQTIYVFTHVRPRFRPWQLVLVSALLGSSACGLGGSGREADPPAVANEQSLPDPCQLLTTEEIGAVQGGPTEPGVPASGQANGHRGCVFGQRDDGKVTTITVFAGDQARFDEERDVVAQNFPVEDIPALGDAAFIGASVLHVRKGELIMTLFAGSPTEAEQRTNALALAPKALARM
jgi:hypothetical protein